MKLVRELAGGLVISLPALWLNAWWAGAGKTRWFLLALSALFALAAFVLGTWPEPRLRKNKLD